MRVQNPKPARVVGGASESPVGIQTPQPAEKSNCCMCHDSVPSSNASPIPKVESFKCPVGGG